MREQMTCPKRLWVVFAADWQMTDPVLQGATILVLDDDVLINTAVGDVLRDAGCTVASCTSLREAWAAIDRERFAGAVLDFDLGRRQTSYEVAGALEEAGVPIVFLTGYLRWAIPARWSRHIICRKPCLPDELRQALREAMAHSARDKIP